MTDCIYFFDLRGDDKIASLEKLSGGWGWLLRVKEVA